jgi:hypothetical protein
MGAPRVGENMLGTLFLDMDDSDSNGDTIQHEAKRS